MLTAPTEPRSGRCSASGCSLAMHSWSWSTQSCDFPPSSNRCHKTITKSDIHLATYSSAPLMTLKTAWPSASLTGTRSTKLCHHLFLLAVVFFPATVFLNSSLIAGKMTSVKSLLHFLRCSFVLPATFPRPCFLIILPRWSTDDIEQWKHENTAISMSAVFTSKIRHDTSILSLVRFIFVLPPSLIRYGELNAPATRPTRFYVRDASLQLSTGANSFSHLCNWSQGFNRSWTEQQKRICLIEHIDSNYLHPCNEFLEFYMVIREQIF